MATYKTQLSGSTTGAKTGQLYRYDAGDEIDAPAGEFDHDTSITELKKPKVEEIKQQVAPVKGKAAGNTKKG